MSATTAKELRDAMLSIIDEQLTGIKPEGWDYTLRKLSMDDLRLVREFVDSFTVQDATTLVPVRGMVLRRNDGTVCTVLSVDKHCVQLLRTDGLQYSVDARCVRDYFKMVFTV